MPSEKSSSAPALAFAQAEAKEALAATVESFMLDLELRGQVVTDVSKLELLMCTEMYDD